jgi:hypothetical protein
VPMAPARVLVSSLASRARALTMSRRPSSRTYSERPCPYRAPALPRLVRCLSAARRRALVDRVVTTPSTLNPCEGEPRRSPRSGRKR